MKGSESVGQGDLHELNPKSAGVGAWVLKVYKMRVIEYECTWQNAPRKAQKLECFLVAANGIYCQGVIKSLNRSGGVDLACDNGGFLKSGKVLRHANTNLLTLPSSAVQ